MLCDEAEAVADCAYFCEQCRNVYLAEPDPSHAPDHARNHLVVTDKGNVATDRIANDGPLRTLYDWPPLRLFVADMLGLPRLHPYGDPLAALMINVDRPGEGLSWGISTRPTSPSP